MCNYLQEEYLVKVIKIVHVCVAYRLKDTTVEFKVKLKLKE